MNLVGRVHPNGRVRHSRKRGTQMVMGCIGGRGPGRVTLHSQTIRKKKKIITIIIKAS